VSGWDVFWIAVYALDLLAIGRAILRGHGVASTFAWIFAIVAFPGFGAALYLFLANPSIRRAARRKRLSSEAVRRAIEARVSAGEDAAAGGRALFAPGTPERAILHLATMTTGIAPTGGNRAEALVENEAAIVAIEEAMRGAKRSILAEYYIVNDDETGHRFLDILAERAAAGLEVRLLYDAFGSAWIDKTRLARVRASGGAAEAFLPLNPLRRSWSVHLRNHRKLVVVDGEVGFTGGMNVGNEYSGRVRRARRRLLGAWRDTHLRIEGPAVRDLAQIFAEDWLFATGERLVPPPRPAPREGGQSVVAIVPSGPDQEANGNGLVYFAGIATARERCFITSPYFVPDEPMMRALESAALRGVDVRLLVPAEPDVAIVRLAARSYYAPLLRAGVRVFEYRPTTLHAKTMVVDSSWAMVGSANLDVRSFLFNFELGAVVVDREFARGLEERFFADIESSLEITAPMIASRGVLARFVEGAARLFSPLL
jgi:cardiolipin synthase